MPVKKILSESGAGPRDGGSPEIRIGSSLAPQQRKQRWHPNDVLRLAIDRGTADEAGMPSSLQGYAKHNAATPPVPMPEPS